MRIRAIGNAREDVVIGGLLSIKRPFCSLARLVFAALAQHLEHGARHSFSDDHLRRGGGSDRTFETTFCAHLTHVWRFLGQAGC